MTFKIAILAEDSPGKPVDSRKCENCAAFVRRMKFDQLSESTNLLMERILTGQLPSSPDYTVIPRERNLNRSSDRRGFNPPIT